MKTLKIISDLLPIPSYSVIIICFFLPFFTIKCGTTDLVSITGFDMVTGTDMKQKMEQSEFGKKMNESLGGEDLESEESTEKTAEATDQTTDSSEKMKPNVLIIIPFVLAIAGLVISFLKLQKKNVIQIIISLLGFISLLAFGVVYKNSPELQSLNSMGSGMEETGLGGMGKGLAEMITISLGNAYYVACALFLVITAYFGFEIYWKKNGSKVVEPTTDDSSQEYVS